MNSSITSFFLRSSATSSGSYIEHQVCRVAAFFDLTVTNGLPPLSPREECTIFTVNGRYTYWPARLFQILIMIYKRDRLLLSPAKIAQEKWRLLPLEARKVQLVENVSRADGICMHVHGKKFANYGYAADVSNVVHLVHSRNTKFSQFSRSKITSTTIYTFTAAL